MPTTSEEIKSTVKTTIDICKSEGVLKNYFEERENEVTEILLNMFETQKQCLAYALERKVVSAIEVYKEVGKPFQEIVKKVSDKFGISDELAVEYVKDVCENRRSNKDYDLYFENLKTKRRNFQ